MYYGCRWFFRFVKMKAHKKVWRLHSTNKNKFFKQVFIFLIKNNFLYENYLSGKMENKYLKNKKRILAEQDRIYFNYTCPNVKSIRSPKRTSKPIL